MIREIRSKGGFSGAEIDPEEKRVLWSCHFDSGPMREMDSV